MNHFGVYIGHVEKVNDPEKLGRVKVRVPLVYGTTASTVGAVSLDDLPWALPSGMPAGGSALSGGMSWLPEVGDQVFVQFLDGEPEKPIWMWSMQTQQHATALELHKYEDEDGAVGSPERSALTRYGHTVEWNSGSLIVTTQSGYRVVLANGDAGAANGTITVATPAGQHLELDDSVKGGSLMVTDDFWTNVGKQILTTARNMRLVTQSGDYELQSARDANLALGRDFLLTAARNVNLTATSAVDVIAATMTMTVAETISITAGTSLTLSAGGRTMTMAGGTINFT